MRVLLHIGMSKAGSTALQDAFARARRDLKALGILYPRGAFNHNFLVAGIDTPEQFARVPQDFDGLIWTNRVEDIAPLVRQRLTR